MSVLGVILLIAVFFFGIAIAVSLLIMKTYSEYMDNKTVFYNIDRPDLTCTIESFNFTDIDNQRMEILVKYPSGNKILVFTNRRTFEKLWDIYNSK
jgi:hypothetical protein